MQEQQKLNMRNSLPEGSRGGVPALEPLVLFLEWMHGCLAAVDVSAQLGFHFLLFCWSWGLSAGQAPSVVMSKASTRLTPNIPKHFCANRSSPIGPYLPFWIPTFQWTSADALHMSMFAIRV